MPVVVKIKPVDSIFDPYECFKTAKQKAQLALFRKGVKLFVWRCSSPHNWYMQDNKHNQFGLDVPPWALKQLGKNCKVASARIAHHWVHRDGGQLEKEGWKYSAAVVRAAEKRWKAHLKRLALREAKPTPLAFDLAKLSEMAVVLLRTLKQPRYRTQGCGLREVPELAGEFAELDAQGLLELSQHGHMRLSHQANETVKVPRGPFLKFEMLPAVLAV